MKSWIKLDRVLLNVLFYIFYVLLVTIVFSFLFPFVLVLLWKNVLNPINPVFDQIQIGIIVLVLIVTIVFRRFFYLPIRGVKNDSKGKKSKEKITNKIEKDSDKPELDIKIGKEIK